MERSTVTIEFDIQHDKPIPSAETMTVVAASLLGSVIEANVDGKVISAFIVKPNGTDGEAEFWQRGLDQRVVHAAALKSNLAVPDPDPYSSWGEDE